MSDYIKREDAIKANENYIPYQRLGEDRQSYMDRVLKELPSADVVEVRHGHWTDRENEGIHYLECSNCGCWYLTSHLTRNSYCPNCGAKMEEEEVDL